MHKSINETLTNWNSVSNTSLICGVLTQYKFVGFLHPFLKIYTYNYLYVYIKNIKNSQVFLYMRKFKCTFNKLSINWIISITFFHSDTYTKLYCSYIY